MINVVFGGSFNPPTVAHYEMIEIVKASYQVDRFVIVPVGDHYKFKHVISAEHRFAMLALLADELTVEVSRIEIDSPGFQGTYQTLQQLGLAKTKFLLGSDNLIQLSRWLNAEKLLRDYGIIVIRRQQDIDAIIEADPLLTKYKHQIDVINHFDVPISSTKYRLFKDQQYVIESVANYIETHHLYEEKHE
jgi:nicotinate-nucleotide adenylyltransferase